MVASRRLARYNWVVSILHVQLKYCLRVWRAITTSSSAALPARSPMPFMVHSICVAPARTAARELATDMPKSSWQWTDISAFSMPSTLFFYIFDHFKHFLRRGVSDGVRDIDHFSAGANGGSDRFCQKIVRRSGSVLRGKLHIGYQRTRRSAPFRRSSPKPARETFLICIPYAAARWQ